MERLMSSHHRTADPEDADLFMVPIATRLTGQIYVNHGRRLLEAVKYIQHTWPFYNRFEGWHLPACARVGRGRAQAIVTWRGR